MGDLSLGSTRRLRRSEPAGAMLRRRRRRRIALLGGTTTWRDCLVALGYLLDYPRLVRGEAVAEYERAFAREIGVRHAISFASGRVGLYGLLLAFGVGEGDEVLVPAPTYIVVPNAVRYTGARPVFIDCAADTWGVDLTQAGQRITPRTKVLLLRHTFGISSTPRYRSLATTAST